MENRKRPVGVIIGSVFLTIVMVVLGYYATLGISVRSAFHEKTIQKTVQKLEITTIQVEGSNLSEYVADKINTSVKDENIKVSENEVKEILDTEEVQQFISENLSEYADAIFNGTEGAGITKDKIKELMETEAIKEIVKENNISEEQYSEITNSVIEQIPAEELTIEKLVPTLVTEQTNYLPIIRNVFSYRFLYIAAGVALVIFVGMIFMNKRRPGFSGVGGILIGVFGCAVGVMTMLGGSLLNTIIPLGTDFFDCILSGFMVPALSIGLSVLIVSVAVLVVLTIINKKAQNASN